jgi:hypothetical protein
MHSVFVRLDARRKQVEVAADQSLRLCFAAEAGHTYAVIPKVVVASSRQGRWYPRVADETANAWVWSLSLAADVPACPAQPSAPVFRIAWPLGQGSIAHAIDTRAGCFAQVKAHVEPHWNPVE